MMSDEITQENGLEPISNNENQKLKEAEMPLSNIQKAKELKNNANLIVRCTDELDKAINKRESLQREFDRRIKHLDNKIETLSKKIEEVKHPTAKAIGLPRLMLPIGRVWFSLCAPNIGILQSLSSNAFPTGLTHHISKGVTLRTSYARYKCMGALYYKLVAFIPSTKDFWDFCLGGLKRK